MATNDKVNNINALIEVKFKDEILLKQKKK